MSAASMIEDIEAARAALHAASEGILNLAERGLETAGDDETRAVLIAILNACAFDDLVGQRLARVGAELTGAIDRRPDAGLINGPSASGLRQTEIDALLG